MRNLLTLVLALTLAALTFAQGAPPELVKARELIEKKELDAAIAILEPYHKDHPQRLGALITLADAYDQKGDLDHALEVNTKLAETRPFRAQAYFNIATIHARRKEPQKAFEFLQKVRDSGSFDMDQLRTDARLGALRDDPRLAALFPKPSDFEKPFVEKVKILHELRGETKNDQFGWIARRVGDVDGDKVADFVTSAPTFSVDDKPAGRIYVYSGKKGTLLWQATGHGEDQLGLGVDAACDVDGDGIPDVIAGAPGSGYAYVYSGRDGAVIHRLGSGDAGESFGRHASTAGDLDGDGRAEVLVGAPGANDNAGAAYVFSGKDGSLLKKWTGAKSGDQFGSTVAGSDDPEHPFLMIGVPGAGPQGTGQVHIYRGLAKNDPIVVNADETGGAFGYMFLSVVGDTNGDGTPDLYVSDWANRAKGPGTGRIYVYSGKDGATLLTLTGETPGDGFGIGVADAGDVDGDGSADLLVGAWQHSSAAPSGGKVYLYSGKDGAPMKTYTSRIAGETFGFDTTNLGDVDGDGRVDFLVTSAWSGVHGFRSGRVFVISSGIPRRKPKT